MPRSTVKFVFELKIFEWASNFSSRLARDHSAFLILFDSNTSVRKILAFDVASELEANRQVSDSKYFLYDPFEWPEYSYIQWKNLNRKTLERIIGHI